MLVPTRIPKHVERINLGFNSIQSVAQNAFAGLKKLELLMMHGNEIPSLPDGVFRELISLQVLKMSYNKVKIITGQTFLGLSNLLRLHTDNNKIEFIHPNAFNGLISLRLLHLEGNLLKQLHPNTFATFSFLDYFKLSSIKHLYLSNNSIETLPSNIFHPMPLLENVYLHGNPWSCDCRLNWLLEWNKKNEDVLKCKKDKSYEDGQLCPMCSFPNQLHKQQILKQNELVCTRPTIQSPLKQNSSAVQEDSENDLISVEDYHKLLGNISLNLTDEHGNKVDLGCQVKRPGESTKFHWNQLHPEEIAMNVTLALDLICPIDRAKYEKLWKLIAYYSEVPVTLRRGIMLSKEPQVSYRYGQEQDNDAFYYTGVKSHIAAEPSWLMQSFIKLQLNRRQTTGRSAVLSFSTQFLETLQTANARRNRSSWVMIEQNESSNRAHTVVAGTMCQLTCKVHSSEGHLIAWVFPDGKQVSSPYESRDKRISASSNGKLIIKVAEYSDSGIYHCIAQVKDDLDTVSFRVDVQDTVIQSSSTEEIVISKYTGDSLLLPCSAFGIPDAVINWILPNNNVINVFANTTRGYVLDNGTLLIQDSQVGDSGYYRCVALNEQGMDYFVVKVTVNRKKQSRPLEKQKLSRRTKLPATTFREDIEMEDGSGEGEPQGVKGKLSYRNNHDKSVNEKDGTSAMDKNNQDATFKRRLTSRKGMQRAKGRKTAVGQRIFQSRHREHKANKPIDPKQWATILAKVRGKSISIQPTNFPSSMTISTTTPSVSKSERFPSAVARPPIRSNLNSSDSGDESSTDDSYFTEDELLPITTPQSIHGNDYSYIVTQLPKNIATNEISETGDPNRNNFPNMPERVTPPEYPTEVTYLQSETSSVSLPPLTPQPQISEFSLKSLTTDYTASVEDIYSGEKVTTLTFVEESQYQGRTTHIPITNYYLYTDMGTDTNSEQIVKTSTGDTSSPGVSFISDPQITDIKTTEYPHPNIVHSTYPAIYTYKQLKGTTTSHTSATHNIVSTTGTHKQMAGASDSPLTDSDVEHYDIQLQLPYTVTKATETMFTMKEKNAIEDLGETIYKQSLAEEKADRVASKSTKASQIKKMKEQKHVAAPATQRHYTSILPVTVGPRNNLIAAMTTTPAEWHKIATASSTTSAGKYRRRRPFGRRRFRPNRIREGPQHTVLTDLVTTTAPMLQNINLEVPPINKVPLQKYFNGTDSSKKSITTELLDTNKPQLPTKAKNLVISSMFTTTSPPKQNAMPNTTPETLTSAYKNHNTVSATIALTTTSNYVSITGDIDVANKMVQMLNGSHILEEKTTSTLNASLNITGYFAKNDYVTTANKELQEDTIVLENDIRSKGTDVHPLSKESVAVFQGPSSTGFSHLKSIVTKSLPTTPGITPASTTNIYQLTFNAVEQDHFKLSSKDMETTTITDPPEQRINSITTSRIATKVTTSTMAGKTDLKTDDVKFFTISQVKPNTHSMRLFISPVHDETDQIYFPSNVQNTPVQQEKEENYSLQKAPLPVQPTTVVPFTPYTTTSLITQSTAHLSVKIPTKHQMENTASNQLQLSETLKNPSSNNSFDSRQQERKTQLKPSEHLPTKNERLKETNIVRSNISLSLSPKPGQKQETINVFSHGSVSGFPRHIPVRGTIRPPFATRGWPHYKMPNRPFTFTNKPEITAYAASNSQVKKQHTLQLITTTTAAAPFLHRTNPVLPNIFGNRIQNRWYENSRNLGSNYIPDSRGTAGRITDISHGSPYYPYARNPLKFNRPFLHTKQNTTSKPFAFTPPRASNKEIKSIARAPTPITSSTTFLNFITTPTPSTEPVKTTPNPAQYTLALMATSKMLTPQTTTSQSTTSIQLHRPVPFDQRLHYIPSVPKAEGTFHKPSSVAQPSMKLKTAGESPMIITRNFNMVSVEAEVDAVLPCDATGDPKPSLTWTKVSTGAIMTENSRIQRFEVLKNGTFIIRNVQLQDRGQYLCTARNQHGIDKMLITLTVLAHQPKIIGSNFKDVTVYLGELAMMDCKAEGMPSPQISWILSDRKIIRAVTTTEERLLLLDNGTLIIKETTFTDRGIYKCIASNTAGADTLTVRLHVAALPPIIQQDKKEDISFTPGQNVYIHCTAKAAPLPAVRWMLFDGTQIRPSQFVNGNLFVFPNGTLFIRNISPRDSGNYECVAMNVVGMSKRIVSLNVKKHSSNAKITGTSAQSTDITYGSTLQLNCTAAGDPGPRIIWRLPSRKLVDSLYSFEPRTKVYTNGTLVIHEITEKDTGDYLCVARNKMGDDFVVLKVNVMMKPATIEQKEQINHKVMYGGDLKVDCIATGLPNPDISWGLPDGTMINSVMQSDDSGVRTRRYVVFDNGTLYFNDVGKKEEGDYTCYAQNKIGKDEMKVHVKVVAEPPFIKNKSYSVIHVPHGDVVTLKCEAKGEPTPKIIWLNPINRVISMSSDKYQVHTDGTLLIQKAQESDNGNYTCTAQNVKGEDKKVVGVQINAHPPKINGYPNAITAVRYNAVEETRKLINCKAEGNPLPRVMWVFPQNIILPAPYYGTRVVVHRNGTLDIKSLQKTDSVQLVCIARNEGGEARLIVQLNVQQKMEMPAFKNPLSERLSIAGAKVISLNCSAEGRPPPEITWILPNGTQLLSGSQLSRFHHAVDGTLFINNPSTEEVGIYRCVAKNTVGYVEKAVSLEIGQRPAIKSHYSSLVSIINGENLQLHCIAQGNPQPQISWTLPNGVTLSKSQTVGRYSLLQNGSLSVQQASVHDRGTYTCKAINEYGSSTISIPVIVIAYPPRITTAPASVTYARPGNMVQLNCMAIGIPRPDIMWELPDQTRLTATTQARLYGNKFLHPQGSLIIQHPSQRDTGFYKCTAKNVLGSDSKATYLHVF